MKPVVVISGEMEQRKLIHIEDHEEFIENVGIEKIIKADAEGLEIVINHVKEMKSKDIDLKNIILQHPEVVFESDAPDNEFLFYIMKSKNIDLSKITKDQFKKEVPPISTIRNFRQKIRTDLQKHGIFFENEMKLRNKDMYVKDKYLHDRM